MKILFIARSGKNFVFGGTRAPDQARRRLSVLLGTPATIIWIGLPSGSLPQKECLTSAARTLGRVSTVSDSELGEIVLCRPIDGQSVEDAIEQLTSSSRAKTKCGRLGRVAERIVRKFGDLVQIADWRSARRAA